MASEQDGDPTGPRLILAAGIPGSAGGTSGDTPADLRRHLAKVEEENRRLGEALRLSEVDRHFLGRLLDSIPTGVAYFDRSLTCRYCNRRMAAFFQHPADRIAGRRLPELMPDRPDVWEIAQRAIDSGQAQPPLELSRTFRDQAQERQRHFLFYFLTDEDATGRVRGVYLTVEETTRAIRAQEAVRQSEARFRHIVEAAMEGIWVLDAQDRTTFVNPRLAEMLGCSAEEMLGRSIYDFIGPQQRPLAARCLESARQGVSERFDCCFQPRQGSELWTIVSTNPTFDEAGQYTGVLAMVADITERKRGEQFREEYISLVSHDLRNPLTAVTGLASLLRQHFTEKGDQQGTHSAELLLRSARRMNAMIQDLVDSARLEAGRLELRKEPLDLAELVSDLAERVGTPEDRTRLRVEAPQRVPPVLADPFQIERALANLITNALKYSPLEQPVSLRVAQRDGRVVVSVVDRGAGIPLEDLPRVFERFYRGQGRRKAEGLGLGLYISRLIVEAHGGRSWVESEVGKGCTFSFSLPAAS